jgi:Flp pilus assembly protein TadD
VGDTAAARREYARADSLFGRDPHLAAVRAFFLLSLGDTVGVSRLVEQARVGRSERLAMRGAFLLAVARGDSSRARALADTALQRYPLERVWYLVDSQQIIRALRPAG